MANRYSMTLAGVPKRKGIPSPIPLSSKSAARNEPGVVRKHRIDAHHKRSAVRVGSAEMAFDCHVIYGQECPDF